MTLNPTNVTVSNAGNATLTVAEVLAGYVTRTGAVGSYTDTLPPTAEILAALQAHTPWVVKWNSSVSGVGHLAAADAGTTIVTGPSSGGTLPGNSVTEILFTPSGRTLNATLMYSSGGGSSYNGPTTQADVTSSRALNTPYTNTSGLPLYVAVTAYTFGDTLTAYSNAKTVGSLTVPDSITEPGQLFFLVLPGQTYQITDSATSGSVQSWIEWH